MYVYYMRVYSMAVCYFRERDTAPVASLRLVSPGPVTDGVTVFFYLKR